RPDTSRTARRAASRNGGRGFAPGPNPAGRTAAHGLSPGGETRMRFLRVLSRRPGARRVPAYRPELLRLEDRLPPGDVVLAGLLTGWWAGSFGEVAAGSSSRGLSSADKSEEIASIRRRRESADGAGRAASPYSVPRVRGPAAPDPSRPRESPRQELHSLIQALPPGQTASAEPARGSEHEPGDGSTGPGFGPFHGQGRFERIKGDPGRGYVELYEFKGFLTPLGEGTGYSYHLGDPGTAIHPYAGCITLRNVPAGNYTLLTSWGEFYPRGKVVSGIVIEPGRTTERNADEALDYSGYLTRSQWDPSGGNPVFHTFVATATSIPPAAL